MHKKSGSVCTPEKTPASGGAPKPPVSPSPLPNTSRLVLPMSGETDKLSAESSPSSMVDNAVVSTINVRLSNMKPIVLLPHLKDVLKQRAELNVLKEGSRVPFSKVNPISASSGNVEKASLRRNATRACRTGSVKTITISENSHVPPKEIQLKSQIKRSFQKKEIQERAAASVTSSKEKANCKFCDKQFTYTDFALEHELNCGKNPAVVSKNENQDSQVSKLDFFHAIGLQPAGSPADPKMVRPPSQVPSRQMKHPRLERQRVIKLFRKIPISSPFGQKMIAETPSTNCEKKDQSIQNYEQFCLGFKSRPRTLPYPTSRSKKAKPKPGDYVHKASFGRRQRQLRNLELIIGLSRKSWRLFNKCKDAWVIVTKLTDEEIVRSKRRNLEIKAAKLCENMEVSVPDIRGTPMFINLVNRLRKVKDEGKSCPHATI